jgi:hypothetical protein
MNNFFVKINLAELKHKIQKKKTKDGNEIECLVIPIDQNNLYHSKEKGNVYLDLVAWENNNKEYNSHILKQSLPKEVREKMSEEELKEQPIVGNMKPMSGGGAPSKPSSVPAALSEVVVPAALSEVDDEEEDIIF